MATSKPRRARTDTVEGALLAVKNAETKLAWPDLIPPAPDQVDREREVALFEQILGERAADDWTPAQLVLAARLAGAQAQSIKLMQRVQEDGPMVLGGKHGTTEVANPAIDALARLQALCLQLQRNIGQAVPGIDSRQLRNSAKAANGAAAAIALAAEEDSLLA